jgi:diguanylate cyclase (GGDEF)-like protein
MSVLQRRIALCFAVVMCILIGRGIGWYRFVSVYIATIERVEGSYRELSGLETILFILKDAETEEQSYLITGEERFLVSYRAARERLELMYQDLAHELERRPSGQATLKTLRPMIDAKLEAMDQTIAARRRDGFAAAQRLVATRVGADFMDRLRKQARDLDWRERSRLSSQLETLSAQANLMAGIAVVGTFLSLLFLWTFYRFVSRAAVRRERDLAVQNAALDRLAMLDPLTSLPNRRHLDRSLSESFAASVAADSPLSLVVIDVDEFKAFNDTFGHPAGDDTLCRVAAVLRDTVREPDLVARYGGEEFAVVLIGVDSNAAMALAERLRLAIAEADWPLRPITASFGVSTREATVSDPTRLVARADRALYYSKARGRNRVTHDRQFAGLPHESLAPPWAAGPVRDALLS